MTHLVSNRGRRSINEDAAAFVQADTGRHCWVVADGLGGQQGGEVAAGLAADAVIAAFLEGADGAGADVLLNLGEAAQHALHERHRAEPALDTMRTTLVLLIADARSACWAHIGDSRLYAFRNGRLAHQTLDHSVPQALAAAGRIQPSDVRKHADRSHLLRALGQPGEANLELASAPFDVRPGDAFLLCTDGAWENMTELEIEADLAKSADPQTWLALLEDRLLSRIRPDQDNYTILGVFATA